MNTLMKLNCLEINVWSGYDMRLLNDGANIAKSYNGEGNCLKEEVHEVVVLSMHKIIAST